MTKINQIEDVEEILHLWPRLWSLAKSESPSLTAEQLLQCFLTCLDHGAVFVVRGDCGTMGSCCVECVGDCAVLHSLPRDEVDNGTKYGSICFDFVKQWCIAHGIGAIRATTTKLHGSSYYYFEKKLGFHRNSVNFLLQL